MSDNKMFSISRKGYDCNEVEAHIQDLNSTSAQLRESYSALRDEHDALVAENSNQKSEIAKLRGDCTTLAVALKKLKDSGEGSDFKAEYDAAMAENAQLKAELEAVRSTVSSDARGDDYGEAASKMISEVAAVVQKLEKDARRKAEAITLSAKMEQERSAVIKDRVQQEVRSLMEMLSSYLEDKQ